LNSGGACVSTEQYCKNTLGTNSQYDVSTKNCECKYGYVLYNNSCIEWWDYCDIKYGDNSHYNNLSKSCECDLGYNLAGNKCVKSKQPISNQLDQQDDKNKEVQSTTEKNSGESLPSELLKAQVSGEGGGGDSWWIVGVLGGGAAYYLLRKKNKGS
jgi:hypothetical protein